MNMNKKYNKLVRDKIPDILDRKGVVYKKRTASNAEYKVELIKKLAEEVSEFSSDLSIEELADVLEVVMAIKNLSEYVNVEDVRLRKKEERGGFEKKLILSGEKF